MARQGTTPLVACFGEILWDVLPHGTFLGGAPLNLAAHLARLGCRTELISRLGPDVRGLDAWARIRELGVGMRMLQQDFSLPTGEARAALAADGSASYAFGTPAAWDAIEFEEIAAQVLPAASALVFGTLAQRDARSRSALARCLALADYRVFDVNLRVPHLDAQVARASLRESDFVKMNEEECGIVAAWLDAPDDPDALRVAIEALRGSRAVHPLQLCITRGGDGALLWAEGQWHSCAAVPVTVVDTIGAGDAFLAMLLAQRLQGVAPPLALKRAAALGGFVASRAGAMPDYDPRLVIPGYAADWKRSEAQAPAEEYSSR
jgi:fructokinase